MPMIDVYFPEQLIPARRYRQLCEGLTQAVLRAEGVTQPGKLHLNNTAAFLHPMATSCIQTAASESPAAVRIEVLTPPQVLSRDGQRQLVWDATELIKEMAQSEDENLSVWVLLKEACEGGWGIAGTAFGKAEFDALSNKNSR